jgi:hypothetical protein
LEGTSKVHAVDLFARVVAVLSLLIGAASFGQSWYYDRVEDIDRLRTTCHHSFAEDAAFGWPVSHPLPDSLGFYSPVMVIRCDLANAGRRTLTVTNLLLGGKSPTDKEVSTTLPDLFYDTDSSHFGFPMSLDPGRWHRLELLFGELGEGNTHRLVLLTPAGSSPVAAADRAVWEERDRAYKADSLRLPRSAMMRKNQCWRVEVQFRTALGAITKYSVSWRDEVIDGVKRFHPCST